MIYISPLAKLGFIVRTVTFLRAQHRFGAMRDEGENEGGIRDDRTFNSRMRGRNVSVAASFAHLDRRDASFLIDCGE